MLMKGFSSGFSMIVKACDVVISTVGERMQNMVNDLDVAKEAIGDGIEHFLKPASYISALSLLQRRPDLGNSINSLSENKHVLFSNFLSNLNVSSIHGSNDESSVHYELHV